MSSRALQTTTIRDFGGGLNVSDTESNLNTRYQPVSDNAVRGTDGSIIVAYGDELFKDLEAPFSTQVTIPSQSMNVSGDGALNAITISKTAHGLTNGHFITLSNTITVDGVVISKGPHRIYVVDANTFKFVPSEKFTSFSSTPLTLSITSDNRFVKGDTLFGRYYGKELVIFLDDGEIVSIDVEGTAKAIWNTSLALALGIKPWGPTNRVSAEVIKGTLIAVNGKDRDKPIVYDGTAVKLLVDGASLSNAAIPRAEFVLAANRYTMLANTEYGATRLEISAKNTTGTYSREPNSGGAVEIDVGMLTQTVDPVITGAGVIRDKVFLSFYDTAMLGTLGVLNGEVHEPDFSDVISLFGAFSHNSIVSLGNDIFCASNNGVVSVSVSALSGTFVPDPVSELIRPLYAAHINRLTEEDLKLKTFAVFNSDDRQYMLFMPKYSATVKKMEPDPFQLTASLSEKGLAILLCKNHQMEEGDEIDISGATAIGVVAADQLNGRRRVRKVITPDQLLIEVDNTIPISAAGGGNAVTFVAVNDETICYAYTYNPTIKIKRWSRLRQMNYRWATRSQKNSIFVGRGKKIFRLGTISHPIHVKERNNYDYRVWQNNFSYKAGDRVRLDGNFVYQCLVSHTSASSGTFAQDLAARPSLWIVYAGKPINWEVETPWSDFGERNALKQIKQVHFDTVGDSAFTFSIFTDNIYRDPLTNELIPLVIQEFTGADSGGFGEADTYFGSGRRTAEEWLWSQPARGKVFKLRFSGTSLYPLTISAVSLSYLKGSMLS